MEMNRYESRILRQLDSYKLEEINVGIAELESSIDKTRFGRHYKDELAVLYVLREHAKYKETCTEIHDLKEQIFKEWLQKTDLKEARIKTFNTWVKYQNQLKGPEFVRDSLKYELEQLQLMEVLV